MASLESLVLSSSSSSCSSRGLTSGTPRPALTSASQVPAGACPPALRRQALAGAKAVKSTASLQGGPPGRSSTRHAGSLLQ